MLIPFLLVGLASAPAQVEGREDSLQAIWIVELQRLSPAALDAWLGHDDAELRARATIALARLRDPAALDRLERAMDDEDPKVRQAAAFGLGLTEGGAALADAQLVDERDELVRARLIASLGLQVDARFIPELVEALDEGPLVAREAALALGRTGRANIEEARSAEVLEALARQLRRVDPKLRRAAAFAIGRGGATAYPAPLTTRLLKAARSDHDPAVRAWLTRGLLGVLEADAARVLLEDAAKDGDRGVRVAVARGLVAKELAASELVTQLLADADAGVRLEAVRAGAMLESTLASELLDPILKGPDVELAAAALQALAKAGAAPALRTYLRPDQPMAMRLAAARSLEDKGQVLRLATLSPDELMRVGAAARLTELEPDLQDALGLLAANDEKVAAVGASIIAESGDVEAFDALIAVVGPATDMDLLVEGLGALTAILPKASPIQASSEALRSIVRAGLDHPQAPVRSAAKEIASGLGVTVARKVHSIGPLPMLSEVERIVSARIFTEVGEVRVSLDSKTAPYTVWNFARLAEDDYFDGLAFHRVVADFVVQGGCPRGDGWGGPGYAIPDELSWAPYDEGALGMALSGPDTGGSQWFLTLSPQPHLEQNYTVFGHLIAGRGALRSTRQDMVIQDIVIERLPER